MDYRQYEGQAAQLQKRVAQLSAKSSPTPAERDELIGLMSEIRALEQVAGEMKDAEIAELRDVVARGTIVGSGLSLEVGDFYDYLKTGRILNAALSTTDPNGGYLVPEPLHAELIEKARKADPILAGARLFELQGNDTLQLPYKATHGVVANATESGARSQQNAPTFTGNTLVCHDYYTDQRATQLAIDSIPDFERMLIGWVIGDIYEQAGVDFAVGDGDGKCSGLFAGTTFYDVVKSGDADGITNVNFLTLYAALEPQFRADAVWLMSSATLGVVSAFAHPATSATTPLVDWTSGEPRILGRPVYECTSAPAIAADAYPVAFADLGLAYAVGIHRRPGVLVDQLTCTPLVRYYGLARIGGTPWHPQAAVLLQCATEA